MGGEGAQILSQEGNEGRPAWLSTGSKTEEDVGEV